MQDWRLLRQYVDDGSDAAFAQLARRYANLVYATCRREVGDADLTEDVAECVLLAVNLPDRAVVEELLIRPRG